MAAGGGHWVTVASGPMAGKMAFVPKAVHGTTVFQGQSWETITMGDLTAFHLGEHFAENSGKWQLVYKDKDGNYKGVVHNGKAAIFDDPQGAMNKATNMQELGVHKAIKSETSYGDMDWIQKKATIAKPLSGQGPTKKSVGVEGPPKKASVKNDVTPEAKEVGVTKTPSGNYKTADGQIFTVEQGAINYSKNVLGKQTAADKEAGALKIKEQEAASKATLKATETEAAAAGVKQSITGKYHTTDGEIYDNPKEALAHQKAVNETAAGPTATAAEAGPVITPKATAAQTAAAQTQQFHTEADFNANKQSVEITTLMNKKETVDGVLVEGGAFGVTKNPKTGEYHVIDAVSGKTVGKYSTAEEAFNAAHVEAKNTTNIQPPLNPKFKPFKSASEADSVMDDGYQNQKLTMQDIHTVNSFQNNSGYANDDLWANKTNDFVNKMDAAVVKTKLPVDSVLIREEGKGHPLYTMAKKLNVGDVYHAKGFDCTSCNPNHSWGGGNVKLVYRAPKGIPAVYGHHYTHSFSSEYEVSLGRGLEWNVVGKTVYQGNITLTLEYSGSTVF